MSHWLRRSDTSAVRHMRHAPQQHKTRCMQHSAISATSSCCDSSCDTNGLRGRRLGLRARPLLSQPAAPRRWPSRHACRPTSSRSSRRGPDLVLARFAGSSQFVGVCGACSRLAAPLALPHRACPDLVQSCAGEATMLWLVGVGADPMSGPLGYMRSVQVITSLMYALRVARDSGKALSAGNCPPQLYGLRFDWRRANLLPRQYFVKWRSCGR